MEEILLTIRLVLAGIFALAGIGKFLDLPGSKKAVEDFGVPQSLSKPFAVLLPAAEIAVAALLLFVQTSWFGAVGGLLLLLVFIGGMIVQMVKGNAPDCHCFGQIHSEPVSAKSLIRNAIFAALALALVVSGRENQGLSLLDNSTNISEGNVMQIIFGVAIVGLLAAIVYFLKTISEQQTQIMRRIEILELTATEGGGAAVERKEAKSPEDGLLIGSKAPDFTLPDINGKEVTLGSLLAPRQPVLFFFVSPTCNPCSALLPEIEEWQTELKDKVKFVFVSSGKAKENAEKFAGNTLKQVLLQKDGEIADKFKAKWTPTAILVNADGTIANRSATGDAAIRTLVEKIKSEGVEAKPIYFSHDNESSTINKPVPEFSFEDVTGSQISNDDLRGKKTLLTYWSVNCGYCTEMLDELREWEQDKGGDDLSMLLLSSGEKEKNIELNLKSPIILDEEGAVAQKLGMTGTPSAVLIDEEGKVISEVAVGKKQIWTLIGKRK